MSEKKLGDGPAVPASINSDSTYGNNVSLEPHNVDELTVFIQNLLQQTQDRFQTMSDQIIKRIDEMGKRIDDLERNISDLMTQAGVDDAEK